MKRGAPAAPVHHLAGSEDPAGPMGLLNYLVLPRGGPESCPVALEGLADLAVRGQLALAALEEGACCGAGLGALEAGGRGGMGVGTGAGGRAHEGGACGHAGHGCECERGERGCGRAEGSG